MTLHILKVSGDKKVADRLMYFGKIYRINQPVKHRVNDPTDYRTPHPLTGSLPFSAVSDLFCALLPRKFAGKIHQLFYPGAFRNLLNSFPRNHKKILLKYTTG